MSYDGEETVYLLQGYTRQECEHQVDRMRNSYPGKRTKEEFYTTGDGVVKCRLTIEGHWLR